MKRPRRNSPVKRLLELKMVSITDLATQAALDRVFAGKMTEKDRRLLVQGGRELPGRRRRKDG